MDPQLQALYARIKARQIGPEEAAEQLKLWKAQHQRVGVPPAGPVGETSTTSPGTRNIELLETVLAILIQAAARILRVDSREIDADMELQEYGFDHLKLTELTSHINEVHGIAVAPELLRNGPTLRSVASYLVDEFADILRERLRTTRRQEVTPAGGESVPPFGLEGVVADQLRNSVNIYLKQLLSSFLKIPLQSIDANAAMDQYGINSVMATALTTQLERVFGSLPKTLFFEYQSIGELTDYFLECHRAKVEALFRAEGTSAAPDPVDAAPVPAAELPRHRSPMIDHGHRQRRRLAGAPRSSSHPQASFDVAIIGLSGRYPGADNLTQFWENLKAGRNCISEIPKDRWDWRDYFDPEKGRLGSIYTKWGGFLSDIDKFDPLFFQISPAEAQNMDPQERLFIEEAYAAIEDAGYTPATLGTAAGRSDRNIGVFVGVMNSTYAANAKHWSISNRVSYLFDFQGPSLAVDTACSSSLTAIHLALESLYRGTCHCALAGGVNLIVDPIHYQGLSALTMLSATDRCKVFGDQADGFVAGEGVGALVLKPLARAVEDGDHIYGVIKASMINAGGKTNGYTVPNPKAQARVIAETLQRAGVDPRAVSYVEAHGTGTALGDPIEIAALSRAFGQSTRMAGSRDTGFCRIGSVKSNIGHLESAAGIAGVTKVLLQLQHRQLVPSLHATVLNPAIDFDHSPFIVQQELTAWPRPRIEVDGDLKEYPRIAGISSFGAGGANAHLIIEEYVADRAQGDGPSPPTQITPASTALPALIVLSAKDEERLKERARRLLAVLQDGGRVWSERDLANMAYTLQVGREAMEERLALIAGSPMELAEKLASFLAGRDDVIDVFRGRVGDPSPGSTPQDLTLFAADEDLQAVLGNWIGKGKYDTLLRLWVRGFTVDWEKLYGDHEANGSPRQDRPRRLSLPTYPFAKERYWARSVARSTGPSASPAILHPMLHRNTSDLTEQRFSTTLSGCEFFLADHVVHGRKILPAVAYLEMAREALHWAAAPLVQSQAQVHLGDVVWLRPLVVGDTPVDVHIGLFPEAPSDEAGRPFWIAYEIYSREAGAARIVHSQGRALIGAAGDPAVLDLDALQAQCDRGDLDAKQCYEAFAAMGLHYGVGHRGIQRLYLGTDQVLAQLTLPEQLRHIDHRFVLHPSLMDAALQASLGLLCRFATPASEGSADVPKPALPFALRELRISGACTAAMWAWVRHGQSGGGDTNTGPSETGDLDIDLCDESGEVCVSLRGLSFRVPDTFLPLPPGEGGGEGSKNLAHKASVTRESVGETEMNVSGNGEAPTPDYPVPADVLREQTTAYLTALIAPTIGLPPHRIEMNAPLGQYGMDSVMALQLTMQLEKTFGPLPKTLFFEIPNIRALSDYFLSAYPGQLRAVLGLAAETLASSSSASVIAPQATPILSRGRPRFVMTQPRPRTDSLDIAVIAVAGRYPKANTLEEFWDNLRTGRDCITEVPADRWDHAHYFDPDKTKLGKAYSKWGGFLDDVDRFDPLFFNIPPREAELMDPQERLFLECVWHVLENAGYTRASLRAHTQGRVGVYVGAMSQLYHAFDSDLVRESAIAVSSYYSIANRVSYFFDFQGPSLAIDTACSSALVAIHLACESLRQGECRLAIAGGVNLSLHPKKYLGLSLAKIIGSHAESRSFGDGDGYIPAEAVGAVLLKPLEQAVRDGDEILAVIKSSAINHSGHTHAYSVPNPNALAQLMIDNFRKSGIDPRTISYVESAANGSAIGDPIELNALTRAFREFTAAQAFCAIGSVKSNIGHAEAASGISQLTKVILQLQHGLLVPSIKAEPLNPNLSFEGSPFYLQRQLSAWRRPVIDGGGEGPRRAMISSFGAGGTNAHLIVEEYTGSTLSRRASDLRQADSEQTAAEANGVADSAGSVTTDSPQIVVCSASNWDRLRVVVERLLAYVKQHSQCSLADLAYTLQMGREAMATRMAMVVASRDELVRGMEEFLELAEAHTHVKPGAVTASVAMFTGDLEGGGAEMRHLLSGKVGEAVVQVLLAENHLEKLALYWTQGGDIPWEALHDGKTVRKVSLPNYPFARQRYWIAPAGSPSGGAVDSPAPVEGSPRLDDGNGGDGGWGVQQTLSLPHPDPLPEGEGVERLQPMTPESFATLSTHDKIQYVLTMVLSEELGIPSDEIKLHKSFQDYGADSIAVLKMTRGLEELFQIKISNREILQFPTVAALSRYLADKLGREAPPKAEEELLHHLLEVQATKTPERVAVVFGGASLTYRELNVRSAALAKYLQQQGAGPDSLVGLCMTRSLEMMVGLVGILKAGAAYVPIDPAVAEERMGYIIDDSGMCLLLTQASLLPRLRDLHVNRSSLQLIAVDQAWHDIEQARTPALQYRAGGDNLAYMIYTSGSTGRPKGVMITHRAAAKHCDSIREHWAIGSETRVLQFTPLSFDASVDQIFPTLSAGATLVLADPENLAPTWFSEMLAAQRIKILNVPPAYALELLREWQYRPELVPPDLKTLIVGGDVLAVETVELWQTLLQGRVALLNAYGPTETTVTACLHNVEPIRDTMRKIPIGRPLAGRTAYILDRDGHPAQTGVAGEIYLGGMGLARGYRHRPALTAAAFVPDPFGEQPGTRLYKTGDLGRFLPDGSIEFLGRVDHQVKVRGYRIELGEIEAVIAEHPEVAQAAVIAVDRQDDKHLVGYVVAKPGHNAIADDLQCFLRQKLPAYMIPSRLVKLEHMPLTSSGKIDRLALASLAAVERSISMPPRDDLERQLCQMWETLLEIDTAGIQDDFFALGGHSLLAIRLLALIRDRFGTELPLATLLQAPTIEALAEILRQGRQVLDFSHLVALQKGTKRPFFCVPGVGGTVFYFLKLARLLGRDQPFYGIQARGLDGDTVPYTSVEDMAHQYVQAIQAVQPEGPYLLGGHSFGGHIAFEMALQIEAMGHEVGALVLIDCPAPAALKLSRTWDAPALFLAFASLLGIKLQDNPGLVCTLLGDADPSDKLAILYDEVIKLNAFPLQVEIDQFRAIFQVYLTNSLMQYLPKGSLEHTQITLLAAQSPHSEALIDQATFATMTDDATLLQRLQDISAAWAEYDREILQLWAADAQLGWGQFSRRPIEVHRVSGHHMNMLDEPHVHALAAALREVLEEQQNGDDLSGAPYPLSKVQEGLWLLQKFSPDMSAYNVPVALRFRQGLDVDSFRKACAFLLEQYPILGSRFTEVNGEPRQYIPAQRPLSFAYEAIDHLNECDIIPFLRAKVKQPFDLEQGPLMRVHLFSRPRGVEQDHIALITIHHIVFDGTSSILLASALVNAYQAFRLGEDPKPVVQDASYQDFVHWEREMMASQEAREHLAWWQRHLAGDLPVLALRTDHPRSAVRGFGGATFEASIDPPLTAQLRALARSQRVNLSTLLLGVYKVLLHRYTGQEDLIVGIPSMGRPKQAFDRVMGCFINMMAVRSRVSGDQSFVDYLKTLQLTVLDCLDHAVYPFSELVRELKVERDQSVSPIFQTYYAYQNYITSTGADLQRAGPEGALHPEFLKEVHQEGDKDLGLEVYEEPERFILNVKYNPALFEAATIQRLLEHFIRLAAAVVQQPYGAIAAFDFFSAAQKAAMLHAWNDTARPFPEAQLLFQLFEEQAAKTPDRTAVVFKNQALSYAELDRRSSRLAAYLQQQGVGPETFVGLYLERSLEIVVGAVGILKAGGVYVPLDPALPEERLAYMIEDAKVAFLLTTASLASRVQPFKSRVPNLGVIYLDEDGAAIERCSAPSYPPGLQPHNLAYVIYTSGSTGRPKGVMISHLTTTRHCYSIRDYFRMAPGERVCLQSPISFDASIEQIFAPLSIGATVAIRDLEVLSPKPFSAMLADLKINIIQLPPAFLLALFREWQLNPRLIPADLKLVISCGDVLAVETVRLWQAMLKERVTLLNVYGPTEVTAKATFHQIDPDLDTANLVRIPIGRPLANKKIYILDRYGHPTPVGVPGELHIGGTGPGRGYHGRPALTAEKFVPDPFSDEPGSRLYRSGDLAYYRDDGTIEFLGRIDHQVKVRGHRIELGEIEAVLAAHPAVKNAAVITVDMRDDKRLVAYLVAKEEHTLDQGDLKAFLGRQLPDFMVPSALVSLDQMPLTPTGKINRRALPLPEGSIGEGAIVPRDAVELELTRIWEEVLEVKNPDLRQDFFALGGHSLLAIRLMVLIEERMGQELPLATLFQAPTIEQLAAILRREEAGSEPTLVPLQALGTKPALFLVPGAGGTVLYLNEVANHLGPDQPVYAFQARGLDGRSEPYTSVPALAEHYIEAMRSMQPEGPYLLGGHSFGGRVAFEMARGLERLGQKVQQLILLDCIAPQPEAESDDWDDTSLLIAFAGALGMDIGRNTDMLAGLVADQDLDQQLERLLHALKQQNLVLPDMRMTRFKGLFQIFKTNN
ncbi:MAG TPA: amino acid adenylation domain-containing protein, partial [Alphaproteobacteria bacterium]|nr:amino acid adenylation domain-containing protein [Alphaproteobacteria bacterium]